MIQERIKEVRTNLVIGVENTWSFINQAVHDKRGHLRWRGAAIGYGLGFGLMAINIPLVTGVILAAEHVLGQPHEPM